MEFANEFSSFESDVFCTSCLKINLTKLNFDFLSEPNLNRNYFEEGSRVKKTGPASSIIRQVKLDIIIDPRQYCPIIAQITPMSLFNFCDPLGIQGKFKISNLILYF